MRRIVLVITIGLLALCPARAQQGVLSTEQQLAYANNMLSVLENQRNAAQNDLVRTQAQLQMQIKDLQDALLTANKELAELKKPKADAPK